MNIAYKVGSLMLKLSVVLMVFTISDGYWSVEGDVKAFVSCHLSDCRNIISYSLHFSKHRGGFRVSDILNSKEHICTCEWLSICTSSFPVPNHAENYINQKVPHFRLHLYSGNYSREFYEMEYLSKLHYKYPRLLSYMNRQMSLDSRKIPKDAKRRLFGDDKKTQHLSLEAILYGEMLSFDFSEKSRTDQDKSGNTNKIGSFSSRSQNYKRLRDQKLNSKTVGESRHLRTRRRVQENEGNSDVVVNVRFKLENAVTTKEVNDEFSRHLKSQLAKRMRVPIPSIKNMKIQSGTDVSFTLSTFNDANNAMDGQTVFEADDFLKNEIKHHKLRLTDLKGHLLLTSVSMDDNPMNFSLVILIVLGVTLLMIVALIIVLVYLAKRLSRIPKASSDDRNRAYRNMDFGRDSSQSVGKYSYDSGLWIGPGPEPSFTVPEAPYYRPPTVDQIASTPRPITAVVCIHATI